MRRGRRRSRAEGVASGRAQIKQRRAGRRHSGCPARSALPPPGHSPLSAPEPASNLPPDSLKRQLDHACTAAQGSREVGTAPAGDQGGSRRCRRPREVRRPATQAGQLLPWGPGTRLGGGGQRARRGSRGPGVTRGEACVAPGWSACA